MKTIQTTAGISDLVLLGAQELELAFVPNAIDQAKAIAELSEFDAFEHLGSHESRFFELIARRAAGEPLSRIRGWQEFLGLRFEINPSVLDPRPETELLVTKGIDYLPPNGSLLDLGTGAGVILISVLALRHDSRGCGVDNSEEALAIASANAKSLNVSDRCEFLLEDWRAVDSKFDLVLCNPPYVADREIGYLSKQCREYDPPGSWAGGPDGLDAYKAIYRNVPLLLAEGGWIGVEIGWRSIAEIATLIHEVGLRNIRVYDGLAGNARVMFSQL
ncbi:peptide chain release factor N(5)-glutamine methyltransferase [Hyphomonas sp.]|uniref:peptide chain release factor N(5)-glutamine methyltransferase n=1 Tax=Hyphomonas sp. TaxID=87 RepID=UPI00391CD7D7